MKLDSHQKAKSIIDSILKKVSEAIDIRNTAGRVVLEIVEDAMVMCNETTLELKKRKERERKIASLRRDFQVIDYYRNPSLLITNPINGNAYTISLQRSDMPQLENVGYDIEAIKPGTTKHIYAALRAVIPDLRRSTSIRIWYTNEYGETVIVPANEMPAIRLVGTKLYVTKLWGRSTPEKLEDDELQ